MEIKKIKFLLLALLMLFSTVVGALAVEITVEGNVNNESIRIPSEVSSGDLNKPSFWENLFQPFAFTNVDVDSIADGENEGITYSVRGSYGPYQVKDIDNSGAGANCDVGEYIWAYELEYKGTDFNNDPIYAWKGDLFSNIYKKISLSDNIVFSEYYTANKGTGWYYGYDCYKSSSEVISLNIEYICTNGAVRSGDDNNINFNCDSGECAKNSYETNELKTFSEVDAVLCKGASADTVTTDSGDVDITLSIPQIDNADNLIIGQTYVVKGNAEIKGVCNGCVIETNNGNLQQAFNIVRESDSGACGDDKTSGINFDAANEWVTYYLSVKAQESGTFRQNVKAYTGCGGVLLDSNSEIITIQEGINVEDGTQLVTCYYCDASSGDILSVNKENCDLNGLFVNKDQLGTCEKLTVSDDGTTSGGVTSTGEPALDINQVTCYWCEDNEVVSGEFENSCIQGTVESSEGLLCKDEPKSVCANNPEDPSCEANSEELSNDNPIVKTENPPKKSENFISESTNYLAGGIAFLLIAGAVFIRFRRKRK